MYSSEEVTMKSLENMTVMSQIQDTLDDHLLSEAFSVITIVIALLGTLGNGLAVLILCRNSLKHIWISAFLINLCIADTVALWAYLFEALGQLVDSLLHTWLCKVVVCVSTTAHMVSAWTIVVICVHLALNISDPFIGQISCKSLVKIICVLTAVPIGICLHLLWTAKLDDAVLLGCVYDKTKYSQFITVWAFIDAILKNYLLSN